jgi:hypothetical protein
MSCNQPILTPVNAPTYIGLNQTALLRAYSQGPRRLMVSDNPELVSGNPAVLWKHTQPVAQDVTQYTHRVFMWHVNDGTTVYRIGPIGTDKAIHLGTVTIPPNSSVVTEFRLMTGGDSWLPVAIVLSPDAF